jgi:hypothetical protein
MGQSHTIALLKAQLQIPLIVHDILAGADRMDDETCYSLHAAIGDLKPHEALLAIALSARTLLAYCDQLDPFIRSIKSECEFIIDQYAGLYQQARRDDAETLEHMAGIAADLSILHTRLKTLGEALENKNPLGMIFCDILGTQAHAQTLVADAFLELFEMAPPAGPKIPIPAASRLWAEGKFPG